MIKLNIKIPELLKPINNLIEGATDELIDNIEQQLANSIPNNNTNKSNANKSKYSRSFKENKRNKK